MGEVTVRPFRPGDGAGMAAVQFRSVREGAAPHYDQAQLRAWMPAPREATWYERRAADGRTTFVAVDDHDRIVGYIDLEPDGHIDHLFCDPDVIGTGVAARLFQAVEAAARASAMPRLYVEASEAARRLFERRAFVVVARRELVLDGGVKIHNYAMQRTLGPSDQR